MSRSSVNCHAGNDSPVWGSETTDCDSCHGLPPVTNNFAHDAHYAAKVWSTGVGNESVCDTCHPDNTSAHSAINGSVIVDAGLNPSGSVSTTSCGSFPSPTGCHNEASTTPAWNTTGIDGVRRFLERAWRLYCDEEDNLSPQVQDVLARLPPELQRLRHGCRMLSALHQAAGGVQPCDLIGDRPREQLLRLTRHGEELLKRREHLAGVASSGSETLASPSMPGDSETRKLELSSW